MDYHGLAGKVKDFKTRPFHSAHLLGRMLIAVVSLLLAGQFTPFSTRLSTVLVGIRPTYHAEIFNGREGGWNRQRQAIRRGSPWWNMH